jgi:hypothetical protein
MGGKAYYWTRCGYDVMYGPFDTVEGARADVLFDVSENGVRVEILECDKIPWEDVRFDFRWLEGIVQDFTDDYDIDYDSDTAGDMSIIDNLTEHANAELRKYVMSLGFNEGFFPGNPETVCRMRIGAEVTE